MPSHVTPGHRYHCLAKVSLVQNVGIIFFNITRWVATGWHCCWGRKKVLVKKRLSWSITSSITGADCTGHQLSICNGQKKISQLCLTTGLNHLDKTLANLAEHGYLFVLIYFSRGGPCSSTHLSALRTLWFRPMFGVLLPQNMLNNPDTKLWLSSESWNRTRKNKLRCDKYCWQRRGKLWLN